MMGNLKESVYIAGCNSHYDSLCASISACMKLLVFTFSSAL